MHLNSVYYGMRLKRACIPLREVSHFSYLQNLSILGDKMQISNNLQKCDLNYLTWTSFRNLM